MHTNLFAKTRKLHNLLLPILISKKSIISDMHHPAMYMYINFQQNQASRSVKTVHTILFANNRKLHQFATCNLNFEKSLLSDMNHQISNI